MINIWFLVQIQVILIRSGEKNASHIKSAMLYVYSLDQVDYMNNPHLMLAQAIRRERKLNKLTQTDLARLSNSGINFISQLERGKETLRLSSLLSVMKVLGLEFHIQRGKGSISVSDKLKGSDEIKLHKRS